MLPSVPLVRPFLLTLVLALLLPFVTALPAASLPAEGFDIEDACPPDLVPDGGFADRGATHGPAIDCLAWFDITQGQTETSFGYDQPVLRGQTVTFLMRMLELVEGYELPERVPGAFPDVTGGAHIVAVETLTNAQPPIVLGFGDGTFGSLQPVTRGQFATFLDRMLASVVAQLDGLEPLPDGGPSGFPDVGATHGAAIERLAAAGIIAGRADGTFGTDAPITRGQAASLLARVLGGLVSVGVADLPGTPQLDVLAPVLPATAVRGATVPVSFTSSVAGTYSLSVAPGLTTTGGGFDLLATGPVAAGVVSDFDVVVPLDAELTAHDVLLEVTTPAGITGAVEVPGGLIVEPRDVAASVLVDVDPSALVQGAAASLTVDAELVDPDAQVDSLEAIVRVEDAAGTDITTEVLGPIVGDGILDGPVEVAGSDADPLELTATAELTLATDATTGDHELVVDLVDHGAVVVATDRAELSVLASPSAAVTLEGLGDRYLRGAEVAGSLSIELIDPDETVDAVEVALSVLDSDGVLVPGALESLEVDPDVLGGALDAAAYRDGVTSDLYFVIADDLASGTYDLVAEVAADGQPVASDTVSLEVADGSLVSLSACEPGDEDGSFARPFCSVQAAVDVATTGALILVDDGPDPYVEALDINVDGITIQAFGDSEPSLLGSMFIDATQVVVEGLEVRTNESVTNPILGENAGVYVRSADATLRQVTVANDDVADASRGVLAAADAGVTLETVTIVGFTTGVFLNPGAGAHIADGVITGNTAGVAIDTDGPVTITGTDLLDNSEGVGVNGSDVSLDGNRFEGSDVHVATYGGSTFDIEDLRSIIATNDVPDGWALVSSGSPGGIHSALQPAVDAASLGARVELDAFTYEGNVTVPRAIELSGAGRDVTSIVGDAGAPGAGTIDVVASTEGLVLADVEVVGIDDNANPAQERAAVYFRAGSHTDVEVRDARIVANGGHGLIAVGAAVIEGWVIDGNHLTGQTFLGDNPAGSGFAQQFSAPNVPRQLLVLGAGAGGTNASDLHFTDNVIDGVAGGLNTEGQEQGNTLVTLDVDDLVATGNVFAGETTRIAEQLRVRRPGGLIEGNTFDASRLTPSTAQLTYSRSNEAQEPTIGELATANVFDRAVYVDGGTQIGHHLGAAFAGVPSGATLQVLPDTTGEAWSDTLPLVVSTPGVSVVAVGDVVLDGSLRVSADDVTLDGLTILGGDPNLGENVAVYVQNATGLVLDEVVLDGSAWAAPGTRGLLTAGSAQVEVRASTITGFVTAIYANPGATVLVTVVDLLDNTVGVSADAADVTIEDSVFVGHTEAIGLGAVGVTVVGNTFDAQGDRYVGAYVADVDLEPILAGNTFPGPVEVRIGPGGSPLQEIVDAG
jgi:hypothetical protein